MRPESIRRVNYAGPRVKSDIITLVLLKHLSAACRRNDRTVHIVMYIYMYMVEKRCKTSTMDLKMTATCTIPSAIQKPSFWLLITIKIETYSWLLA